MPHRVFAAIVSKWDANSLNNTIAGGIWFPEAPKSVGFPYAVMTSVGDFTNFWTSHGEYSNHEIQLDIYYMEDGTTDPGGAVGLLMEAVDAVLKLNHGQLSIPSAAGNVLCLRNLLRNIEKNDEEERVWRGILSYEIKRRRAA